MAYTCTSLLSYNSVGQKSNTGLTEAKIKVHFFLEAVGENSFPYYFQPVESTCIPWFIAFLPLSSKPATSEQVLLTHSPLTFPLSSHLSVTTAEKGPWLLRFMWLHWTHQDHLFISRSIISTKFFLSCKVIYSQVLRIRAWASLGQGHYFAYHIR